MSRKMAEKDENIDSFQEHDNSRFWEELLRDGGKDFKIYFTKVQRIAR